MTEDRNGEPSGSPERLVVVIEAVKTGGRVKSPRNPKRRLTDWMRLKAESDTLAYVCEFFDPPGWGVCFVRPDGDFFKYYPNQETAKVAAMMGV